MKLKLLKKNNNSTYNLLVCYVHVNNPPIQNKKQKKCLEKKVLKKVICIIHTTSNYCNLLRRNHDLRIFQKKNSAYIHSQLGKFLLTVGYYYNLKIKTEKNSYCNILQLHIMYDKYHV